MKIGIFGTGYVGVVTAACFLRDGHEVTCIDPITEKTSQIQSGRSPIQEPQVAELLLKGHDEGRLSGSPDPNNGVRDMDLIIICVGTPSQPDGSMDLTYLKRCVEDIGSALRETGARPLIVLRSTSLPGTTRNVFIPALESASGLTVGDDIDVVFHPEFLREGKAVDDFDQPPKIVVGEHRIGSSDRLMALYPEKYDAPRFHLSLEEAELVKYSDNIFHAVKVTFANEIGAIARSVGVDGRRVADVFCSDTKLNISPTYLRPGFAFGGSCLPKDLRAILRFSTVQGVPIKMLDNVMVSNAAQIETLVARVLREEPVHVGMVGLAFKPDTDDMRESPYVTVAKRLLGEGIKLSVFDPGVDPSRLIGANKAIVQKSLGHLEAYMRQELSEFDACDLVLINHPNVSAEQVEEWLASDKIVIDLVGISGIVRTSSGYSGVCW